MKVSNTFDVSFGNWVAGKIMKIKEWEFVPRIYTPREGESPQSLTRDQMMKIANRLDELNIKDK